MCNDYTVYKEDYKSYQIRIEFDFDAQNPRTEFDELGKIVLFGRYDHLSDNDLKGWAFESLEGWEEWIKNEKPQFAVCLPLDVCDNGSNGISLRVGSYIDRSSRKGNHTHFTLGTRVDEPDGFMYITREDALKEYSAKILTNKVKERAENLLRGELETYNDYLQGNVYGWIVEKDGEHLDSVWGFYGDYDNKEYGALTEARSHVDYLVEKEEQARRDLEVWQD